MSALASEPRPVWPVAALLGEGPAWFPDEALLRFVDIKSGMLHSYHPASGRRDSHDIGGAPSFVVAADDGGLIIGSRTGVYRASIKGLGAPVALPDMPAHNRTNDATVDNMGRLWFGTMDDGESRATGALWCRERGRLHRVGGDAVVTNGPAITGDGGTLYHVDSGERTIWRFTIAYDDGGTPRIAARDIFLTLGEADGYPDGVVLDAEGCLWVALWGGWGVRRYAPDGALLAHISLPCARVTKMAFGGPGLRTAFVTTARIGLDEAALAAQPLAGALFTFEAPCRGLPLPSVRLAP